MGSAGPPSVLAVGAFAVLWLSAESAFTPVGRLPGGTAVAVDRSPSGEHVAVGLGRWAAMIDVRAPEHPTLEWVVEVGDRITSLRYGDTDGRIYVGAGRAGLAVVQWSETQPPRIVDQWRAGGPIVDLALSGRTLIVAARDAGTYVWRLSDLGRLLSVEHRSTDWTTLKVGIDGSRGVTVEAPRFTDAIARSAGMRLRYWDLAETQMTETADYEDLGATPEGLAFYSGLTLVTAQSRLLAVDARDPRRPTLADSVALTNRQAVSAAVIGEHAFVGATALAGPGLLEVFDVGNWYDLQWVGQYDGPPGSAITAVVAGSSATAYAAMGGQVLGVFDVGSPSEPQYTGGLDLPDVTGSIASVGTRVYAAGGWNEFLHVLDVGPTLPGPSYQSYTRAPGPVEVVAAQQNYVFAGLSGGTLILYECMPDGSLRHVGQYSVPFSAIYDLAVSGSHVVLAQGDQGMTVVDAGDPSHLRRVASKDLSRPVSAVVAIGPNHVVVSAGVGLTVVDLSDPTDPVVASEWAGPIVVNDLDTDDRRLYAAELDLRSRELGFVPGGVSSFEVQSTGAVKRLSRYTREGGYASVATAGARLYAAAMDGTLDVFDIGPNGGLTLVAPAVTSGVTVVETLDGDLVVTSGREGLVVWSAPVTPGGTPTEPADRHRVYMPVVDAPS